MNFNIRFSGGQLLLTTSEVYAQGGSSTTANLSEHIRQILREELAEAALSRREATVVPREEVVNELRLLLAGCGRSEETDEAVERARAFLLRLADAQGEGKP